MANPVIVFIALGSRGDVQPLLLLAGRLKRRLATDEHLDVGRRQSHSAPSSPVGEGNALETDIVFATHASVWDEIKATAPRPLLSLMEDVLYVAVCTDHISTYLREQHSEQLLATQLRELSDCDAICGRVASVRMIVFNLFAMFGYHLAEKYRVPAVCASPCLVPQQCPAKFGEMLRSEMPDVFNALQSNERRYMSDSGEDDDRVEQRRGWMWRDVEHWLWRIFVEDHGTLRETLHLSPAPLSTAAACAVGTFPSPPLLLYGLSSSLVSKPAYWPIRAHCCGFWVIDDDDQGGRESKAGSDTVLPQSKLSGPPEVDQFLDLHIQTGRPFVYVGFGSMATWAETVHGEHWRSAASAIIHTLQSLGCDAILACHGSEILWNTWRPLATTFLPRTACDTETAHAEHASGRPSKRARQTPIGSPPHVPRVSPTLSPAPHCGSSASGCELLVIQGGVYHPRVLRHARCAIHHGGSGTFAQCLLAAVPQIIVPFTYDQFFWADKAQHAGVGLRCDLADVCSSAPTLSRPPSDTGANGASRAVNHDGDRVGAKARSFRHALSVVLGLNDSTTTGGSDSEPGPGVSGSAAENGTIHPESVTQNSVTFAIQSRQLVGGPSRHVVVQAQGDARSFRLQQDDGVEQGVDLSFPLHHPLHKRHPGSGSGAGGLSHQKAVGRMAVDCTDSDAHTADSLVTSAAAYGEGMRKEAVSLAVDYILDELASFPLINP